MLSVTQILLFNLLWTVSALKITKPLAGDTIDISFPYNVTWTWDENDPPLVRMQITPTFEESTNIITAAGVATFWAGGDVISAQSMVEASPVEIQLVNPNQFTEIYAFVGQIKLINSANISAAPSTYSTTIYPGTVLATSSSSTATSLRSSTLLTSTSTGLRSSTSVASTSKSTAASDSALRNAGLSIGAIVAIVIGVVAAIGLIAAIVLFSRRGRKPKYDGADAIKHDANDQKSHIGGLDSKHEMPHENQVYEMYAPRNSARWVPQAQVY